MIAWLLQKILGTKHERELKKIRPRVAAINDLEPKIKKLTDEQLRAKTAEFREKIDNGAKVDELLVEAFAVCREGGRRALNMRHFDVQLIGGMVLHRGAIAEMRTGEGKTLVATLPAYLNALEGKGVHIVTVNDYLAKRDAEWMGRLYGFLGMRTGTVVNSQGDREKFDAYRCDITYGQNNEFGFDYLRDNMKYSVYECAQRPLHYAIVDEVDSILVDEARTPLIISGQGEASSELYNEITKIMPYLKRDEHYTVDEKAHSVMLTDEGIDEAEERLKLPNLYDPKYIEHLHVLQQCLRAHTLYKRDVNYMVTRDGKVMIIDEFTGRVLAGRRWSDGLHQAVEAKEFVRVQEENRTMATITFQNLFRIYKKLAGMTGTAETEAEELHSIYKLDVVPIPTNKPVQRKDYDDLVYKTEAEKFAAVAEEITDCVERGQPCLVGTVSVQKSEAISQLLKDRKINHEVLNAKQHEREAYIVAQAGRRSMVTVATNMAGRGTDIVLGGNPEMLAKGEMLAAGKNPADPAMKEELEVLTEKHKKECEEEKEVVLEAGGLHIIGTERHESRRIDNQLRGRAGRQGDPGSSRFFLSLEDDLMKIFAGENVQRIMESLGMEDGVPIEHPWVTSSVENAQKKVEGRNFDIRKNLLDYDDVMNQQRKAVYLVRREVLEGTYGEALKDAEGEEREPHELSEDAKKRVRDACANILRNFPVAKDALQDVLTRERNGEQVAQALPPVVELKELEAVNAYAVEQEAYRYFGRRVLLEKLADKPAELLEELAEEVEWSLRLQRERVLDTVDAVVVHIVKSYADEKKQRDEWDTITMSNRFAERFGRLRDAEGKELESKREAPTGLAPEAQPLWEKLESLGTREDIAKTLFREAAHLLELREKEMPVELQVRTFRDLMLEELDRAWVDHLTNMDHLRDGIGLRGYGQRDPKFEFKKEGFEMYKAMIAGVYGSVLQRLYHMQVQRPADAAELEAQERARAAQRAQSMKTIHLDASNLPEDVSDLPPEVAAEIAALLGDPSVVENVVRRKQPKEKRSTSGSGGEGDASASSSAGVASEQPAEEAAASPPPEGLETVRKAQPKIGRNDPCPCGSGKKYKKCHGATEGEAST